MSRWHQFEDKFEALPARQRVMLAVALALLIVLPMLSYVIIPNMEKTSVLGSENARLEQQIEQVNESIEMLKVKLDEDINRPLRQELKLLKASKNSAQQSIKSSATLQEVSQRKAFLNSVLNVSESLEMQNLITKTPRKVFETGSITLYEHAVEAAFTGTYFDILDFVEVLQRRYPNVIWAHFDYQVQSYPQGQVTLEWQLLSTDKEFISG